MAITIRKPELAPLTLALALQFRDMKSVRGERELKSSRSKEQARLLAEGKFFTLFWGKYRYEGNPQDYRSNGNHTSHLLVACMQAAQGTLDEKSRWFFNTFLATPGGAWSGSGPEDLPRVAEKQLWVMVESAAITDAVDEVTIFSRWDSRKSVRSAEDMFGIFVRQHADLNELEVKKVGYALAGVLRAAKVDPQAFGFRDQDQLRTYQGDSRGFALNADVARQACRWIVETVPEETLYHKTPGAQVFAEAYTEHGPDDAERIVDRLMEDLDNEEEPATSWEQLLNKRRNKPTLESLVKKGRTTLRHIASNVLQTS